jgi:hypothetical protein
VIAELVHDDAPEPVRAWAANLPSWISAQQNPDGAIIGMEKLQAGEQAAILLAESIPADMILLDEKVGSSSGRRSGFEDYGHARCVGRSRGTRAG